MDANYLAADPRRLNWYALFVRSNQERRVAERLRGREVEFFLPSYPSVRQWKDRRVKLDMPLFPGYVFVRVSLIERIKVLSVPNVVSLVGTRNSPTVVSDDEIASIRCGIEHGKAAPHEYLRAGEKVEITEGAMCGMRGILVRRQNGTRVVISLDSIARSFLVEVEAAWLRPLGPSRNFATASAIHQRSIPEPWQTSSISKLPLAADSI